MSLFISLYPVVHGNGRYVTEKEVIVGNYWFPKKVGEQKHSMTNPDSAAVEGFKRMVYVLFFQTQFHLCHYAVCHDEAEFVDTEKFVPERWLRNHAQVNSHYQHHPYSFIPFGVGVRACVGKRVAELEMHFALSRVSQQNPLREFNHANRPLS